MVKNNAELEKGIVSFDGENSFYQARIQYKINYDKQYNFLFASQQSTIARYRMNDNDHSLFGMKTS